MKNRLLILSALVLCLPCFAEPPAAYPRQPIPGLTPNHVIPPTPPAVVPGTVKACKVELIDCLKDVKDAFPLKEDREFRDGGIAACRDGYSICRGKVVAAALPSVFFDSDWLAEGIVSVHAPSFSVVELWMIDETNTETFLGLLHESAAIEGQYFADDVVFDRLGTDTLLVAHAQPMFDLDHNDEVATTDLLPLN